jgi:hypothetical protein
VTDAERKARQRELTDFHLTFSTDHGRRVLDALRRDLYDKPSGIVVGPGGTISVLDYPTTMANEGLRQGYQHIENRLAAYRNMTEGGK